MVHEPQKPLFPTPYMTALDKQPFPNLIPAILFYHPTRHAQPAQPATRHFLGCQNTARRGRIRHVLKPQ